jgi:hypothetical protein
VLQPRSEGLVEAVLSAVGVDMGSMGEHADQIALAAAAGVMGIGLMAVVRWARSSN